MTKKEANKAAKILAEMVQSHEIIKTDTSWALSVTFNDGHQKIFCALDAVEYYIREATR